MFYYIFDQVNAALVSIKSIQIFQPPIFLCIYFSLLNAFVIVKRIGGGTVKDKSFKTLI